MTATSMHDILLRPVISEKSVMETERNNYTFAVARDANKLQIKQAVEAEFKVNVLGVRVLTVKPKQKRRGRRQMGTVPGWRKAVVTIAAGQKIELVRDDLDDATSQLPTDQPRASPDDAGDLRGDHRPTSRTSR